MPTYEYKVIPAPEKASKIRGLKGPALFAASLEEVMNELAADGWSYLRAETLPQEERSGLTAKTTTYRNLLVFQRALPSREDTAPAAEVTPAPSPTPVEDDSPDENLWAGSAADTPSPEDEGGDDAQPLFPNRQRQGVDL